MQKQPVVYWYNFVLYVNSFWRGLSEHLCRISLMLGEFTLEKDYASTRFCLSSFTF